MYGSKKPEEKYAWQVAYTVSKDGKFTERCELSPGELVERLSIRNKYVETDLTTEGLQKIQEDQEEHVKKEIDRQAATEEVYEFADDDESWMMLDSLCALLGEERSKTHKNWMSVGWALNNIHGVRLTRELSLDHPCMHACDLMSVVKLLSMSTMEVTYLTRARLLSACNSHLPFRNRKIFSSNRCLFLCKY